MRYDINYSEESEELKIWLEQSVHQPPTYQVVLDWLQSYDEDALEEGERLNLMLCAIKWAIENDCISDWWQDELYLYYEDLMSGKLDDIIDEEEREIVVHDLTKCFKKVFPNGLED